MSAQLFGPEPPVRSREEEALQRSVVRFLQWALPNDAEFWHTPNGGPRSKISAARLVGMGVKSGVPDIEVVYQGRCIFFELKAKRGSLSPTQRQMHRKLVFCGVPVITCRCLDCIETSLRELGVPLRASVQGWLR